MANDIISRLRAESHELESKKKQLDVSINTLQTNFDDSRKTLIEDCMLYVIEAIRQYIAETNATIEDLLYDLNNGLFRRILTYWLKQPSGEFIDSLIHAP